MDAGVFGLAGTDEEDASGGHRIGKEAIRQYEMHMKMIKDDCVNAVLERIVKDEEYHIMLLRMLLEEC